MHLCTSSDSPCCSSCSSYSYSNFGSCLHIQLLLLLLPPAFAFKTFSFVAEKKLLQIYCLCFLVRCTFSSFCCNKPFYAPAPSLDYNNNHNISRKYICCRRSCCILLPAALNTRELAYCSGHSCLDLLLVPATRDCIRIWPQATFSCFPSLHWFFFIYIYFLFLPGFDFFT